MSRRNNGATPQRAWQRLLLRGALFWCISTHDPAGVQVYSRSASLNTFGAQGRREFRRQSSPGLPSMTEKG